MEEITYDNIDLMSKEAMRLKAEGKIRIVHVHISEPKKIESDMVLIPGVGWCKYTGD